MALGVNSDSHNHSSNKSLRQFLKLERTIRGRPISSQPMYRNLCKLAQTILLLLNIRIPSISRPIRRHSIQLPNKRPLSPSTTNPRSTQFPTIKRPPSSLSNSSSRSNKNPKIRNTSASMLYLHLAKAWTRLVTPGTYGYRHNILLLAPLLTAPAKGLIVCLPTRLATIHSLANNLQVDLSSMLSPQVDLALPNNFQHRLALLPCSVNQTIILLEEGSSKARLREEV